MDFLASARVRGLKWVGPNPIQTETETKTQQIRTDPNGVHRSEPPILVLTGPKRFRAVFCFHRRRRLAGFQQYLFTYP